MGVAREALVGRLGSDVFAGFGRNPRMPYFDCFARVAQTGQPAQIEYHIPERDVRLALTILPLPPGNIAVIGTDITVRRREEIADAERHVQERRFRDDLQTLLEVHNALTNAPTVDALCRRAVELGRKRLGLDRLSLWFVGDPPDELVGSYGVDESGILRDERARRLDLRVDSPLRQAVASGELMIVEEDVPLYNDTAEPVGEGTHITVVMRDGAQFVGVVVTDNLLSQQPFTALQRELLGLFATTLGHLYLLKRTESALQE